ncbi:MAG: AAA family ATPase [Gammaproteobacteria bacterium]|nr:AAA family ATPase [Gammaproteobacteria bacterium]
MIPRDAFNSLIRLAKGFPIVFLTGPRQSGKTTLARELFSENDVNRTIFQCEFFGA